MGKKIRPIDVLRREKQILRSECSFSEAQLAQQWQYISNNIGSLVLAGAVGSIKNRFGFGTTSQPKDGIKTNEHDQGSGVGGLLQGTLGGILAISPVIWEIVQPMVMGFAIKKIKSIFTRKKKKKKNKNSDNN